MDIAKTARSICPNLEIVKMNSGQIAQVAALEAEMFSVPWSAQAFADTLPMDNVLFYTAVVNNCVVGYCGIYLAADEGEITNVAVAPPYRRQRAAEALVSKMLEDAAQRGIQRIFLEVRSSNKPAVNLYRKMGFRFIGTRKNFYQYPTEDAFMMMYEPD